MKRFTVFGVLCFLVLAGLVGCGGEQNSNAPPILDYKSILDTEIGNMFSLGDTRANIEAALGQPIRRETHDEELDGIEGLEEVEEVEYQSGLTIMYSDNKVIAFAAENRLDTGRFEIFGYRIGMTRRQIANVFGNDGEFFNPNIGFYYKFYDAIGNPMSMESAESAKDDIAVFVQIIWFEGVGETDMVRILVADGTKFPAFGIED